MKLILIILSIFRSTNLLYGQDQLLFQKYNFDTSYKVIGVGEYNREKSFYVFSLADLNKIKSSIKFGKKIENSTYDNYGLNIYIIKDKEIQKDKLYISLEYSTINIDGKYYEFDISQLVFLSEKYPINYTFGWSIFKSKKEFKKSILSDASNKKFICYQNHTLRFGGLCYICIDRNAKCTTGEQGIEIIKQKLLDLGFKGIDFLIEYEPTFDESKKFKLSLQATKDKYDKLKGDNFQKSKWRVNEFNILSYWEQ